jgi:hypothetical protein
MNNKTLLLNKVFEKYTIEDKPSVIYYLTKNYDLISFILNSHLIITNNKEIISSSLEYYYDIEEGWDKIFIAATTSLSEIDSINILEDNLFNTIFMPNINWLKGRVVFTIN